MYIHLFCPTNFAKAVHLRCAMSLALLVRDIKYLPTYTCCIPCLVIQRSRCTCTGSKSRCRVRNSRHSIDSNDSHCCWLARYLSYLDVDNRHVQTGEMLFITSQHSDNVPLSVRSSVTFPYCSISPIYRTFAAHGSPNILVCPVLNILKNSYGFSRTRALNTVEYNVAILTITINNFDVIGMLNVTLKVYS